MNLARAFGGGGRMIAAYQMQYEYDALPRRRFDRLLVLQLVLWCLLR